MVIVCLIFISSCLSSTHQYPAEWASLRYQETSETSRTCPRIDGIYHNYGNFSRGERYGELKLARYLSCHFFIEECDLFDFGKNPEFSTLLQRGNTIEIRQPSNDVLEIVVWKGGDDDRIKLKRKLLSADNDDFICSADGIELKDIHEFRTVIISSGYASVERILTQAKDNSLVMNFKKNTSGYHVFIPIGAKQDIWLLWNPHDKPVHLEHSDCHGTWEQIKDCVQ